MSSVCEAVVDVVIECVYEAGRSTEWEGRRGTGPGPGFRGAGVIELVFVAFAVWLSMITSQLQA